MDKFEKQDKRIIAILGAKKIEVHIPGENLLDEVTLEEK